jgi:hypothetical protein
MEFTHGHDRYWTTLVSNQNDGYAGVRLHRERFGQTAVAASVIFWDASGQFFVQTLDGEVPVTVIELVIDEARSSINVR